MERSWDLPPWNHPLSQGVFPLFVIEGDRVIPVGTAVLISRHGLVATAYHNIVESLHYHRFGERLRLDRIPDGYHVDDMNLCVLHHVELENGDTEFNFWFLKRIHGGPPSDVVYGVLEGDPRILIRPFSLSPGPPRIGSTVLSVGYCEMQPKEGIPWGDIKAGRFDWRGSYSHRLRLWEGTVEIIFSLKFASSYIGGPCFLVDFEVDHGLSGGPTFARNGFVCGVNSAGVSHIFGSPKSLISMIYPTLGVKLRDVDGLDGTLMSLIRSGRIISDESVDRATVNLDDHGSRVDIKIHMDDAASVFEDAYGYEAGSPAAPLREYLDRFEH